MEYHVVGYLLSYSLYLVLNSTLPNCEVNNAQLSSPYCQVSIPKLPTPYHQCNIVKLPSPNSLCELPEWASQCPTKKIILGCPMHKLLFWSAEPSAQKFRLPLNLFFTGCLDAPLLPPAPPLPFPSWAFSLSYFFGLDGSLKLGRSPLKIQSTQLTFEHIKSKLEDFEFKFHVFFISIFMNHVHLKPS
jgi:hypothetical protein